MVANFIFACLLSLAFVSNAKGQVCGTAEDQRCNATQIFSSLEMSNMAESTSETNQGVCSYLVRLSEEIVDGQANLSLITRPENGTEQTTDTETATLTENPDIVNLVFASDPNTTYEVELPYANYSACFVTRFDAPIGCRLWVYEGTAADTVEACKQGHVQVCGETVYSTYNETLCGTGPAGSA